MNPLRLRYALSLALAALALSSTAPAAQTPTADDLRRVLEAELLKLAPAGTTRTVLFEDVRAGSPNGGYYPFRVTATLHDYHPGYPKNKYYGTGSRLMAGMGFVLKAGGAYQDTDGGRKGSYVYDASTSTISFKGGFLDGQAGKNVRTTGFTLSSTVNCEPWR